MSETYTFPRNSSEVILVGITVPESQGPRGCFFNTVLLLFMQGDLCGMLRRQLINPAFPELTVTAVAILAPSTKSAFKRIFRSSAADNDRQPSKKLHTQGQHNSMESLLPPDEKSLSGTKSAVHPFKNQARENNDGSRDGRRWVFRRQPIVFTWSRSLTTKEIRHSLHAERIVKILGTLETCDFILQDYTSNCSGSHLCVSITEHGDYPPYPQPTDLLTGYLQ
jgi:hypothetical protein